MRTTPSPLMVHVSDAKEWGSKAGLLAHLEGYPSVIVGSDAEAPRTFSSFSVVAGDGSFELGLICSDHGIAPSLIVLGTDALLIGHDQRVTWVDVAHPKALQEIDLSGVFYEFLRIPMNDAEVLVIHELGLARVDARGKRLWAADAEDIVGGCSWDAAGTLDLTLMESGAVFRVDPDTGTMTLRTARPD